MSPTPSGVTRPDLAGTVALRMDDPGASASVQLDGWSYTKLEPGRWEVVGDVLERERARLSIGYTPGWVDDGDGARGELFVSGAGVERVPGRVHPSPLVRYEGRSAHSGDYAAEFAAMLELRRRGLAAIELHGYTHVHPDRERWARSPTAHEKVGWYRELGAEVVGSLEGLPRERHPLALGYSLFAEHFGGAPRALLCPGNACGEAIIAHAFELGFEAIAARSLAVRGDGGFEWVTRVPTLLLEHSPPASLAEGEAAIASFHDRDLALHGPQWLERRLAEWRGGGARRFVDVAELAAHPELKRTASWPRASAQPATHERRVSANGPSQSRSSGSQIGRCLW